jgi:hypothetical protein
MARPPSARADVGWLTNVFFAIDLTGNNQVDASLFVASHKANGLFDGTLLPSAGAGIPVAGLVTEVRQPLPSPTHIFHVSFQGGHPMSGGQVKFNGVLQVGPGSGPLFIAGMYTSLRAVPNKAGKPVVVLFGPFPFCGTGGTLL